MTFDEKYEKETLEGFFSQLKEMGRWFHFWTGEKPNELYINPELMAKLSKIEGFYQRPELQAEVSAYAPIVRYFKLDDVVVTLVDDWEEKYLHFE